MWQDVVQVLCEELREAGSRKKNNEKGSKNRWEGIQQELVASAVWCITLLAYSCRVSLISHNSRRRSRQRQTKTCPAKSKSILFYPSGDWLPNSPRWGKQYKVQELSDDWHSSEIQVKKVRLVCFQWKTKQENKKNSRQIIYFLITTLVASHVRQKLSQFEKGCQWLDLFNVMLFICCSICS